MNKFVYIALSLVLILNFQCKSSESLQLESLHSAAKEDATSRIKKVSTINTVPFGKCGSYFSNYSPDENYFIHLSGSTLVLNSTKTGKIVSTLSLPCDASFRPKIQFYQKGFSSDGKYFVFFKTEVARDAMYIVSIPSLKIVKTIQPYLPQKIAIDSKENRFVYVDWKPSEWKSKYDENYRKGKDVYEYCTYEKPYCQNKHTVVSSEFGSFKPLWKFELPISPRYTAGTVSPAIAISPNGKEVTVVFSGNLFTFSLADGKLIREGDIDMPSQGFTEDSTPEERRLVYSEDGKTLYKSFGMNYFMSLPSSGPVRPSFETKDFKKMTVGEDGIRFFHLQKQETIQKGKSLSPILYSQGYYWNITNDGSYRFQLNDSCTIGELYETKTGSLLDTFKLSNSLNACNESPNIEISPNGNFLRHWDVNQNDILYSSPFSGKKRIVAKVIDLETKQPLPDASIEISLLTDFDGKKKIQSKTDGNGMFDRKLPSYDLEISFSAPGYSFLTKTLKDEDIWQYPEINLTKLKPGSRFYSNRILFDSGKSDLKEDSKKELLRTVTLIKSISDLNIIIVGHTDHVGNDAENLKLSLSRANEVKSYLVANGVSESRLTVEGKGAKEPIRPNTTEQGKAENRRIEFLLKGK
ncbi:OmpA family protein [Leptospira kemamanensis]|uniref:OmpA family protein n=1 Tax=Leptospira kemamanensis TaxID=2484942 RepID=A0A4R9JWQ5_9LEPT|nr:OmpA family protein [Leptospira kemamanensis]TGL55997.1 OmpA family protein [Leptospira kemamanensis]